MMGTIESVWHRLYYTRLRDALRGRFDASLDWRQTVALANLPPELADAVQQVVRRTRLWRREKVDVASELVAHFQDGLAAGRSPAELLQSFGDGLKAAQLIRRAKKRNRPMYWRAWRYGWMTVAGVLLLYIGAGLWMSLARPSVRVDYIAAANNAARAVPENERAWPIYRDALLAMGFSKGKLEPANATLDLYAKPGGAKWKATEEFLNEQAGSIAKLREAANRPNLGFETSPFKAEFSGADRKLFGFEITPEDIEVARQSKLEDRWAISTLLPELQYLKEAGTLLAADARRAAAAGDGKTAYDNVVAILGISRHCEEAPFLVCTILSDYLQKMAHAAIRDILSDHASLWTDVQLHDLAHKLAATPIDWRRGIEGERTCIYDSMQRIYTDNGHGDGRLALHVTNDKNLFQLLDSIGGTNDASPFSSAGIAMLSLPVANMVVAPRKEMVDMYDHFSERALSRALAPYWTWAKEPSLDAELKSTTNGPISRFRYLFVSLLTPSYDTLLNRIITSNGDRDGIFIGLALELYHREHKKWPDSLAELSPRYLPTVPVDPITGAPLRYKVVDGKPLVYSVGGDGDDDGGRRIVLDGGKPNEFASGLNTTPDFKGKAAPDGDWVLWTTAKN